MARSKSPKSRSEQPAVAPPKRTGDTVSGRVRSLFRPRLLILAAMIPLTILAAPIIQRNWPRAGTNPVYRLEVADIRVSPAPPRPVPATLIERAIDAADLGTELDVTDRTLLPKLAAALAGDPWVRRVVRLKKGLPAHVLVELEYRRPVAMIDVKQGVYPIDEEGVLLPPGEFSPAESRLYPLITGVRSLPTGPPGTVWQDPVVQGAARIAAVVGPQWDALDLAAIHAPAVDVARPDLDDLTYELHAAGGSKIVWGRPPGTGHPGELTAEQKLGRLKRYVTDFGPLDAPGPVFEIDIRPWQEITRRPLLSADRLPRRRW